MIDQISNEIIIKKYETIKKLIIVFHGYGADAENLKEIGDILIECVQDSIVHIPDAFSECEASIGRQWFTLQNWNAKDWKQQIKQAVSQFTSYLNNLLTKYNLSNKEVIVAGFSQGGMMAMQVGLEFNLKAIISLSGAFLDSSILDTKKEIPQILMIHGEADNVLSVNCLYEAIDSFSNHGFIIEKHALPKMGHYIDMDSIKIIKNFLSKID